MSHNINKGGGGTAGSMKLKRVLMEVTAIVIVILFFGMAMFPATSYTQSFRNNEGNRMIESNIASHISNAVRDNKEISHKYMKIQEAHIRSINIEFNKTEAILNFQFEEWLNYRDQGFIYKKLNHSADFKLFGEFLNSSLWAQYAFNKLVKYEQSSNKINMDIALNSIQNSNGVNLANYNEIAKKMVTYNNSKYLITEFNKTRNSGVGLSHIVEYLPLGKNQVIDPDIMVQINPIQVSLWFVGTVTVGDSYYIIGIYHNNNALHVYQAIGNEISCGNYKVDAMEGVESLLMGAAFGLASAGIGLAVGAAMLAIFTLIDIAYQTQDRNNLNAAFDSTYQFDQSFEMMYYEVKMFFGASNAFTMEAWNFNSQSWSSISPTAPYSVSGFANLATQWSNKYGNNNWVYVTQQIPSS